MPKTKKTPVTKKATQRTSSRVGGVKQPRKLSWQLGFMSVLVVVLVGVGAVYFSRAADACYQLNVGPKLRTTKSPCVSYAQGLLNYRLFGKNTSKYIKTDGYYGAKTRDTLKVFQAMNKIKPANGQLDKTTWSYLCLYKGTPTSAYKLYFKAADCGDFYRQD